MTQQSSRHPSPVSLTGPFTRRPLALAISSLLLGGALAGSVQAQVFPPVLKLADLDGSNGFRLDGEATYNRSGVSVSAAGDINGDGFDDLIIGAHLASPDGKSGAGSSYVVFGQDVAAVGNFPSAVALSSLKYSTGFRIDGVAANHLSGFSVSSAGDINGDGIDDLIIGALRANPDGNSNAGSTFVVFGRDVSEEGPFPAEFKLADLDGTNGFRIDGVAAGDRSGTSVSAAGDINGDGIDDLIIGAPEANPGGNSNSGSVYVVFGRNVSAEGNFPATMNLSSLNGTNGFRLDGEAANDYAGRSVSAAGDINGDGIDDLIIGAPDADPNGNSAAGSSYVVFGRNVSIEGPFPAQLKLADLNGSNGFRIDGEAAVHLSGTSVSTAGDINGDGIDDVIIGATLANPGFNNFAGSSYVVFGRNVSEVGNFPATLALSSLDGSNGFRIEGVAETDLSGRSVSAAGDINGDGIDDLIIGAYRADVDGIPEAGSSYVVFGRKGGFPAALKLSSLNGSTGFRIDGEAQGDRSGISVSAAGDINGDGIDDLIIGAYRASPDGVTEAGSSYVVFGRGDALFADRFESE